MGDMSAEPSMEEILSSIKRIIAEEGEGPVRSRRAPRTQPAPVPAPEPSYFDDEDAEVLELSDPIPAAYEAPVDEAPVEDVVTMAQPHVEPQLASIRPAGPAPRQSASAPAAAPAVAAVDPILSDRTAQASRSALDNLTRLVAQPDVTAAERNDDGSLEGVVRSMLRPMLRDWLDTNLPAMVEEMVASEIARITGQPR
ncbi:DUF2497 domain-containing protein [Sphingomonas sp. KR1UV-12]|uniref:DUF2497 domain-containing protein n=1 Tax=Sphingomonas aurea TaxID=3063994 RepID=A0ABT9EHR5_9SPHN|nr:DUF2497 domain-containing protein [Sphingomonas sp. KR1UV-12]MDP1026500.1 DUF2497 domain-containing protein [Sphingomonas sp. KR1UV-12]